MVTLCHCDPTALTIEGRGKPEEEDVAILLALISSDMAAVRVNGVLGGPFSSACSGLRSPEGRSGESC